MGSFQFEVHIIWRRIYKPSGEVKALDKVQELQFGRPFGVLKSPMLAKCSSGKHAMIFSLPK
jgi:hypothetical protein